MGLIPKKACAFQKPLIQPSPYPQNIRHKTQSGTSPKIPQRISFESCMTKRTNTGIYTLLGTLSFYTERGKSFRRINEMFQQKHPCLCHALEPRTIRLNKHSKSFPFCYSNKQIFPFCHNFFFSETGNMLFRILSQPLPQFPVFHEKN